MLKPAITSLFALLLTCRALAGGPSAQKDVFIKGVVNDYDKFKSKFSILRWIVNDPILGNQVSYDTEVGKDGSFTISFPLTFSQDVMLGLGEESITRVFIQAGDSIEALISAEKILKDVEDADCVQLSGRSGVITRDLLHFSREQSLRRKKDEWEVHSEHIKNDGPPEYAAFRAATFNEENQLLAELGKTYSFSKEGAAFIQQDIRFHYFDDLLRYPWLQPHYSGKATTIQLPESYLQLVADLDLNNEDWLVTSYFSTGFLKGYESYQSKFRENYYSLQSIFRKWLEKDWSALSQQQQDWVNLSLKSSINLPETLIKNRKELNEDQVKKLREIAQAGPRDWKREDLAFFQGVFASSGMDYGFGGANSSYHLENLKKSYGTSTAFDLLLANTLVRDMEQHLSEQESYIDSAIQLIRHPLIRERLRKDFDQGVAFLKNPVLPAGANLNNISANPGDSLLQHIAAQFPGKALYIDFWATWCGPCIAEMSPSQQLKKSLEGEDVVFIYLCGSSPEPTWKQMIGKMGLKGEHYLLNNKQQEFLYKKFKVTGIPHYVLVNKNGEVVKSKANRPSSGDAIRQDILKVVK